MKMPSRTSTVRNDYRCSMEKNQGGKYCVRIRVHYPRHAWSLGVFFLASSFDRAMKKLEQSLDFLQRHEEKLWFWGVDRAADMGFSAEFLREAGLKLDRRIDHVLATAAGGKTPIHFEWYRLISGIGDEKVGTDSTSYQTPALIFMQKPCRQPNGVVTVEKHADLLLVALPPAMMFGCARAQVTGH